MKKDGAKSSQTLTHKKRTARGSGVVVFAAELFCVTALTPRRLFFFLPLLFFCSACNIRSRTHISWPPLSPQFRALRPASSSLSRHRHYGIASPTGLRNTRPPSTRLPVSLWLPLVLESTTTHLRTLPHRKTSRLLRKRRRLASLTRRPRRRHNERTNRPSPNRKVCKAAREVFPPIANTRDQTSPSKQRHRARMTCPS